MRFLAGNFWVFSGCVIGYGQLILSTGFHRRVLQGFYEGLMNLYAFIWWRFSCFYRGLTFCFFSRVGILRNSRVFGVRAQRHLIDQDTSGFGILGCRGLSSMVECLHVRRTSVVCLV